MLYSTRHFWRIVIILLLIALIAPHIPEGVREIRHLINSVRYYVLHLLDILQI